MNNILTFVRACLNDNQGVTLVEYGIALSLAILVGTAALTTLGGAIIGSIEAAATEMPD